MRKDVQFSAKTAITIMVMIFAITRVWGLAFSTAPLGYNLAWLVWGIAVFVIGAVASVGLRSAIWLLCKIFRFELEQFETVRAIYFWGAVFIARAVVYELFPQLFEFIYDTVGIPERYVGEMARAQLFPEMLGRHVGLVYFALVVAVVTKILLSAFSGKITSLWSSFMAILFPIAIVCVVYGFALVGGQVTLHRIWVGFYVLVALMLFGVTRNVYPLTGLSGNRFVRDESEEDDDSEGSDTEVAQAEPRVLDTYFGNVVDNFAVMGLFFLVVVCLIAVAVAGVVFVYGNREVVF